MSDKTLEEVAREAFTKAARDPWESPRPWQAVAEAVAKQVYENERATIWAKRNAVIEAAKAALQPLVWACHSPSQGDSQEPDYRAALGRLFESVEALLKVEG